MEKKIIVSKRFRNDTLRVYQYLLKEFPAATASDFLDRLEKRINFIADNPETGKLSAKRENIRSISVSARGFAHSTIQILKFLPGKPRDQEV